MSSFSVKPTKTVYRPIIRTDGVSGGGVHVKAYWPIEKLLVIDWQGLELVYRGV